MKLSDYVADFVAKIGNGHVFLITGGAIAHVVDSVGKKAQTGEIEYVCVQHEQAGAMAAEAYSRLNTGLGIVLVTSGPGATNLITGICGAWFDSVPALFISGQVNTKESIAASASTPRQVGFQETDIVSIVKPITKMAEAVSDPNQIRYVLEKALYVARSGRPGPVLVDLPVDLQIADINPNDLPAFKPPAESDKNMDSPSEVVAKIKTLKELIAAAERPVILLGAGIRLAEMEKEALQFAEQLGFPIVVSWSGFDLLAHDHPQHIGDIGVYGNRGANFAVQNSDLLIGLGSRMDTRQTGGKTATFARGAKKVMIDVDKNEITKGRGLAIDLGICTDLRTFLPEFSKSGTTASKDISSWLAKTKTWKEKYSSVLPEYFDAQLLSPHAFVRTLSDIVPQNQTIIVDEGGNLVWTMQSWQIKQGQRLISTFGNSPMGYALPAAIGASLALGKKDVICIDGDGGFQMNIQELQTVFHYKLPLKIFILNNGCYGIIQQFQDAYFDSRYFATGEGYSAPDFVKIATAYGIDAIRISNLKEAKQKIKEVLDHKGPILCDVTIDPKSRLNPKLEFGRALEDMSPYLPDEEFFSNMIVSPLPRDTKKSGWKQAE